MEGPFGGPGGGRFQACGAPPSIRTIEIRYERDPSPLIQSLKVKQESDWNSLDFPRTNFGDEMIHLPSLFDFLEDGKEDKVCI
jgi:hypothetical protein